MIKNIRSNQNQSKFKWLQQSTHDPKKWTSEASLMTIKISTENQNNKTYFEKWLWWSYFDICIDAYNEKSTCKNASSCQF
jgi:hypothetical protein